MRKIYLLFLMLLSIGAMAQVPSNDACSNALAVALPASGSVCFNSSNINATSNGSITCDTAGPGKEVWYTFIATNSNNSVTVTPNGASPISNVVVTLMTGGCGSGTYDMCNSGTGSNPVTSTVGLVPGTQVWVSVESNGGGTGDFQVCINSTPPSSSPGDGCASASNVCDKSTISYPDLTGFTASGVQPACFAAAVRKDVWIKFTVGVTGTLEFLGTPIAADEYDWALYDVTSGCLGTLVSCNYNYASAGPFSCGIPGSTFGMLTTTTGQPCAAEFNAPVTVTAGRTYALLIDNYSQTNSGFTLDWGGTFQMGTTASFTATPQSSCSVPLVVNITNNSVGASTYQWNFGDGSTSTSPNPGTHTYTSTGDYLISLVVTGNGCTSVISKRINLNTGPVIAVTPASQTICPGDSVNLNGVLSLGTPYNDRIFTNNVNTAIPNNNAAGLTNALTTSGMLNTTLTTGSVQSICFTINHSDHSDIGRGPTPTAVQVTVNGNTYNFTPLPLPAVSGTATYCFPQAVLNAINAAGGNSNTTWTLKVADNRGGGGGTGSLVSWEVVLRDFNSITGYSWSPTTNMVNSTTLTPTVTPVSSTTYVLSATDLFGCSTSLSVPITVNAGITPTFTAVAPICSGGTLSALPTTSNNGVTGTWSPALNNTATTVYTFTPTAGQCASTVTMTITVNPNVTPTFTAVAPICSGGTLSALPTTSNNGITGTWSPALNNTATTVYTFTPTAGQCATTTTMTITVNPNVTPTFTAVAPICSGGTLSALPTTSNNGITGTWSPALNNTATTLYTFTPTAGQCATTTTMTITVNPNVTPTFTAVAPICSGAALSALPTTSNNGITGTWSPALNNTATTLYTFTPTAGQCATTTTMTITVNPNVTPTFTAVAPICSGAALSALPTTSNNGITGTWSPALNNTATTLYTFTPTAGQCATTTTMTITVNPNVTPTFTAVAPICSGAALSALPTTSNNGITGTWSPALNNTATTVYTFTPTAGQCATTTTMTITVNPLPANPTATVTFQPTCVISTGTIVVTAPTGATLEYSIDGVAYQSSTTFAGLAPGTYNVTVHNTATNCYSGATVLIVNPAPGAPATPTASVTVQPTCTTPTGTIVITAPTGATLEYSINGVTFQAGTTFTGVAPGTYTVMVRDTGSGCSSATSVTVNPIPANPAAPTASATVQPTCTTPTGTIVITAPLGAALEYSVNGVTYQSSTSFAGLASGTYSVTVRDTATGCVSYATSVTVNPIPANPAAPTASATVQPTCTTPTGTIVITAPTGATLQYSINGVTYQAGTSFTGLTPGVYSVTVRDTATGCVSSATSVTVNPIPANPVAPTASTTVQPTCTTPVGTIVVTAPTGATLEYSINGVTYQTGTSFTGLASGTYNVTVRDTATGCISSATSVTVNPIPANPAAPTASATVQPTCTTPVGTIVVTAPTGATLEYSINGVAYQAGTSFAGLASGTYNVTVRDTATGCVSSATSVTVNPIPANPAIPTSTVVSPSTCAITTGSITVTAPIGATLEYSVNGVTYQSSTSFTGLASGTYNVTVRDTATGCVSSAATETINPAPGAPAAPTASATVQPTCTIPTGAVVITAPLGATLEYSVDGITYQSGTSFAGLTPGVYSVTVRDTVTGCVSSVASVTVNPIPANPATPTASVTVQPTCTTPTGTIVITAPIGATLEYSVDGVTYQAGTIFAGLVSATYNVTVRDTATGCVSSATSVTVNPIPANPAIPTSTVVSPSTCAITTGSITVTAPIGATLEYSIDGVIYQSGTSFTGLASGTYNVTVRDTATGCISSATTETINPAPGAPAAPTATATVQPTCTIPTGTIVVTAPIGATLEYSVDGITYQSGTSFTGLTPGTYSVTVRDTVTGCVSSAVSVTVNPIPTAPAVPVASVTLQPTCAVPTGTIDVTTPIGATLEYSIDGVVYQTGTSFAGLAPGNYTVSVRDMVTGCVSSGVAILVVDTVPVPVSVAITGGCIDGNYTLTATPMDDTAYSYEWFDSTGASVGSVNPITVTVAGMYTVEVTALGNGCVSQDVITVASAFCDIPRGISPNGDGKNDAFDIAGLNAKSVKIFNRYGVATFTYGSGYTNQWHGQSNSGQELPDGTYYYVIDTADGQTRTGWVYINRER